MTLPWLIYGANGYTGKLVAEEAKKRGLSPILGGRGESVRALALALGLESRIFDLSDAARGIRGMKAVLHCAGPFSATSKPMLDACLSEKAHYLDITGEIPVFEAVHARSDEIARAGIVALPGAGFDVVPSDCLSAMLKDSLPDASHLSLAFHSAGPSSPGTTKTMMEGIAAGGAVRRQGRIVSVDTGAETRTVDFGRGPRRVAQIPWGDVSTAYYSTGIPNIEVYTALRGAQVLGARVLAPLVRIAPVQRVIKRAIGALVRGPSEQDRESLRCELWGEVRNAAGASRELRMEVPEGYRFTVDSALACVKRVLEEPPRSGALTPSMAFGKDFVLGLAGVRML